MKISEIPKEEVMQWAQGNGTDTLETFGTFLKKLLSINDFAEHNIRLIQDFVTGYKAENMKQNLLVARSNRNCLKKELPKNQLSKNKKSPFSVKMLKIR